MTIFTRINETPLSLSLSPQTIALLVAVASLLTATNGNVVLHHNGYVSDGFHLFNGDIAHAHETVRSSPIAYTHKTVRTVPVTYEHKTVRTVPVTYTHKTVRTVPVTYTESHTHVDGHHDHDDHHHEDSRPHASIIHHEWTNKKKK